MNLCTLLIALLVPVTPSPPAGLAKDGPSLVIVERMDLVPEVRLKGAVGAEKLVEIRLRPQAFQGPWRVAESADAGHIKAGDVIVRFESGKLEQEMDDTLSRATQLEAQKASLEARANLQSVQAEVETVENALELEKARNELKIHMDYDAKLEVSSLDLEKRQSEHHLSMQEEELRQLDDMYSKNELAESTRDYVVERERRGLELNKEARKLDETRRARRLEHDIPKSLHNLEERVASLIRRGSLQAAQAASASADMKVALLQVEAEIARCRRLLSHLESDTKLLTLRAAEDGVLVTDLQLGDDTAVGSTVATLHVGGGVRVEAQTEGMGGEIQSVEVRHIHGTLKASVLSSTWTPKGSATSAGKLVLRLADSLPLGTKVDIVVTMRPLQGVLCLERSCLTWEGSTVCASRKNADGRTEPVEVVTGPSDGKRVQILEGLSEGDRIEKSGK